MVEESALASRHSSGFSGYGAASRSQMAVPCSLRTMGWPKEPALHASSAISPDEVPAHRKSLPPAVTPARPRKKLERGCSRVRECRNVWECQKVRGAAR